MLELGAFMLVCVVAAMVSGIFLRVFRPNWSARRTAVGAAVPLPAVTAGVCLWLLIGAMDASREECGVDACGMFGAFSVLGLATAAVGFVLGLLAVEALGRLRNRR